MARLVYSMVASLDDYVADENGASAGPSLIEEVHASSTTSSTVGIYLLRAADVRGALDGSPPRE